MSIIIKELDVSEVDEIETLWNALKQHHHDRTNYFDAYYQQANFAKRRAEYLAAEQLLMLNAEMNQVQVGFSVSTMAGGRGEIESLYVVPSARGNGIAAKFMSESITWLKQQQADSIRLLVGDGNESVIEYYQQLGFRTRATQMELLND